MAWDNLRLEVIEMFRPLVGVFRFQEGFLVGTPGSFQRFHGARPVSRWCKRCGREVSQYGTAKLRNYCEPRCPKKRGRPKKMGRPITRVKPKKCLQCKTWMTRKKWDGGRMESVVQFKKRQFCNSQCWGEFDHEQTRKRKAK